MIGLLVLSFLWVFGAIGCYFMYYIIKYITSKPLGSKTLLDGVLVQTFQSWILEGLMCLILKSLITLEHTSWTSSWIVGWAQYFSVILATLHLMFTEVTKISLMFHQEFFEEILDWKILLGTR